MKNALSIKNINKFIKTLPETISIIGYGSGIKPQVGYTKTDRKQIDLIIVVEDAIKFHLENIKKNPKYYSSTSKFFFKNMNSDLHHVGSDICYVPYIKHDNNEYKIGVIEKKDLIKDLKEWETFYLAGRFHKDILVLKNDEEIDMLIKENRHNALVVSLLKIYSQNKKCTLKQLYTIICSLSYIGDTRMTFAENPNKIKNIVDASFNNFKKIYSTNTELFSVLPGDYIKINKIKLLEEVKKLPCNFLRYINDIDDIDNLNNKIDNFFKDLNTKSSLLQTLKGVLTAGPIRGLKYGIEKVKKSKIKKI